MIKTIFLNAITAITFVISSACNAGSCDGYETFRFSDQDINNAFIEKLIENDIEHKIGDDGKLAVASKDKCEFNKILKEVSKTYMPAIGFSVPDSSFTNDMLTHFENEGIEAKHVFLRSRVIFSFQSVEKKLKAERIFETEFKNRVYEETIREQMMREK